MKTNPASFQRNKPYKCVDTVTLPETNSKHFARPPKFQTIVFQSSIFRTRKAVRFRECIYLRSPYKISQMWVYLTWILPSVWFRSGPYLRSLEGSYSFKKQVSSETIADSRRCVDTVRLRECSLIIALLTMPIKTNLHQKQVFNAALSRDLILANKPLIRPPFLVGLTHSSLSPPSSRGSWPLHRNDLPIIRKSKVFRHPKTSPKTVI